MRVDNERLTILGAGYVGQALLRAFPAADSTHRSRVVRPAAHVFDLDDAGTWDHPPLAGRAVVWTFPAAPPDLVRTFHDTHLKDAGNLIVLGSTSAYLAQKTPGAPGETIDEGAPLDMSQPRVQGEEWLRLQGATVLQLAGIFGPGRDPADWLRRGLIRDGAKLVNLIHVDDIVAVIARLLTQPLHGERINVANGEPLSWRALAARLRADGRITADFTLPESRPDEYGKRVDNGRLRGLLPGHRFLLP